MSISKNWIDNNLFTKTGNLNNRAMHPIWWEKRNYTVFLSQLQEKTSFLEKDSLITERVYCFYHDLKEPHKCPVDGKPTSFRNFKNGYYHYCSNQCVTHSKERNEKISRNNDYQKIKEKVAETNIKKYGVQWTTQVPEVQKKIGQTKLKKYGNSNFNNMEKHKQTNIQKYGFPYSGMVPSIKEKIEFTRTETLPELRNKDWLLDQNHNKKKSLVEIAENLGITRRSVSLWFDKHGIEPIFYVPNFSKMQKEIADYINVPYIMNDRNVIGPKELDIYIPSKDMAIELNGCYWHSGDSKRHLEKLNLCRAKNIRLIQFWDHEWKEKQDICKSIIDNCLGKSKKIYARKCIKKNITNEEYKKFLEENHIQGWVSSSIKLGLFYDDEIVSVIGLSKPRFNKQYKYELIRHSNKIGISIVGGLSKLLKGYSDIISYCDLRLFSGNGLKKVGFNFIKETRPNYFYYKNGVIKSRLACQKHKLPILVKSFDPGLSETKNMARDNWLQVFDCGNSVWHLS